MMFTPSKLFKSVASKVTRRSVQSTPPNGAHCNASPNSPIAAARGAEQESPIGEVFASPTQEIATSQQGTPDDAVNHGRRTSAVGLLQLGSVLAVLPPSANPFSIGANGKRKQETPRFQQHKSARSRLDAAHGGRSSLVATSVKASDAPKYPRFSFGTAQQAPMLQRGQSPIPNSIFPTLVDKVTRGKQLLPNSLIGAGLDPVRPASTPRPQGLRRFQGVTPKRKADELESSHEQDVAAEEQGQQKQARTAAPAPAASQQPRTLAFAPPPATLLGFAPSAQQTASTSSEGSGETREERLYPFPTHRSAQDRLAGIVSSSPYAEEDLSHQYVFGRRQRILADRNMFGQTTQAVPVPELSKPADGMPGAAQQDGYLSPGEAQRLHTIGMDNSDDDSIAPTEVVEDEDQDATVVLDAQASAVSGWDPGLLQKHSAAAQEAAAAEAVQKASTAQQQHAEGNAPLWQNAQPTFPASKPLSRVFMQAIDAPLPDDAREAAADTAVPVADPSAPAVQLTEDGVQDAAGLPRRRLKVRRNR
ncbi:hypothetical protein WJX79_001713 [Trebouxia sp. C0005]